MHTICGLARSGSTLLCNILAQNPRFCVTSTSPLVGTLTTMQNRWSQCPEIQSALISNREETLKRLRNTLNCVATSLVGQDDRVLFDKCRLWNHSLRLFQWVWPNGTMIVLVRDLRAILGSLEKQHAKSAIFEFAEKPIARSLLTRSNFTFSDDGVIGRDLAGVHDLIRRKGAYFIKYEDLVARPKKVIRDLYEILDEEAFEHQFDDVKNVSSDVDELYHLKFPHSGQGKVQKPTETWRNWVSKDIAQQIIQSNVEYNRMFQYE